MEERKEESKIELGKEGEGRKEEKESSNYKLW